MPISLTMDEKCYLVAIYGDIPERERRRLFGFAKFPPQAGPLVMQDGYDFRDTLNDGTVTARKRKGPRKPFPWIL